MYSKSRRTDAASHVTNPVRSNQGYEAWVLAVPSFVSYRWVLCSQCHQNNIDEIKIKVWQLMGNARAHPTLVLGHMSGNRKIRLCERLLSSYVRCYNIIQYNRPTSEGGNRWMAWGTLTSFMCQVTGKRTISPQFCPHHQGYFIAMWWKPRSVEYCRNLAECVMKDWG